MELMLLGRVGGGGGFNKEGLVIVSLTLPEMDRFQLSISD